MSKHRLLIAVTLAAVLVVAGMIFFFSAQQGDESSQLSGWASELLLSIFRPNLDQLAAAEQLAIRSRCEFIVRKLAHFSEYALLGFSLMAFARARWKGRPLPQLGLAAWLVGTLYAVSDEVHQVFVEGRGPALGDVCIDSGGVLFGVFLLAQVLVWRRKRAGRAAS